MSPVVEKVVFEYYMYYKFSQLHVITVQVHTTFNFSRTKENITTKRRRSFAFAFECSRSFQRTKN